MKHFGPKEFQQATGAPPATIAHLETYALMLAEWNRGLNLIAKSTLPDIWHRHFWDSAQLGPLAPRGASIWLDIGSGAGFPGMVLAILGVGDVHLVERGQRKAEFLAKVASATLASAIVHSCQAEDLSPSAIPPNGAHILTARAVARPAKLLHIAAPLLAPGATVLLPAGRGAASALTQVPKSWKIGAEIVPSRTDPNSGILRLRKGSL